MAKASFLVEIEALCEHFDCQAGLEIEFQQFIVDHVSLFIRERLQELPYFGRLDIVLFFQFDLVIAQQVVFNQVFCGRQRKIAVFIVEARRVREIDLCKVSNTSVIGGVQNLLNWNLRVERKVGDG